MSKRLQVLFEEDELAEFQEIAHRQRVSLAEWVRHALREARRRTPRQDAAAKRAAVRQAEAHGFPTADIDKMLEQIEAGYGGD